MNKDNQRKNMFMEKDEWSVLCSEGMMVRQCQRSENKRALS